MNNYNTQNNVYLSSPILALFSSDIPYQNFFSTLPSDYPPKSGSGLKARWQHSWRFKIQVHQHHHCLFNNNCDFYDCFPRVWSPRPEWSSCSVCSGAGWRWTWTKTSCCLNTCAMRWSDCIVEGMWPSTMCSGDCETPHILHKGPFFCIYTANRNSDEVTSVGTTGTSTTGRSASVS